MNTEYKFERDPHKIYFLYNSNRYEVLKHDDSKKYVLLMEYFEQSWYNKILFHFDEYFGLRPAGHFFSYNQPFVWVYLSNNLTQNKKMARNRSRGFYVTITTIDDSALYADWEEPITGEQMNKVLWYFNEVCLDGLDTAEKTLHDIEGLVGIKCSEVSYS